MNPRIRTRFIIEQGTPADYDTLAPWHYRSGPPATFAKVIRARCRATDATIGVLVVSHPVLNATWRPLAWPSEFPRAADPTPEGTQRANALIRCISRVIIDPRYRALGLASELVRTYLRAPLTPLTEAVAAMSEASPFFERAGMRRVLIPPSRRDRILLKALAGNLLTTGTIATYALGRSLPPATQKSLDTALLRWAGESRATRTADHPIRAIAALASLSLNADRAAYVHEIPAFIAKELRHVA